MTKYIMALLLLLTLGCEAKYCPTTKVCSTYTAVTWMHIGDVMIPQFHEEESCYCPVKMLPYPDGGCK